MCNKIFRISNQIKELTVHKHCVPPYDELHMHDSIIILSPTVLTCNGGFCNNVCFLNLEHELPYLPNSKEIIDSHYYY